MKRSIKKFRKYSLRFSPLLLLSLPLLSKAEHWQDTGFIVDSFVSIALHNEYKKQSNAVRKWTSPITYYIDERTGDEELHSQLVSSHLNQIKSITKLPITQTSHPSEANLKIIFSKEANFKQELQTDFGLKNQNQIENLANTSACLAVIRTSKQNQISQASVIIPVDRARAYGKLISCIVEELTQVMGLPNDSVDVFPSVFNDKSHDELLSGLDLILLKLLYDPRVKTGMSEQQVITTLPKIINETLFQHNIQNAELEVSQSGIAQFIN